MDEIDKQEVQRAQEAYERLVIEPFKEVITEMIHNNVSQASKGFDFPDDVTDEQLDMVVMMAILNPQSAAELGVHLLREFVEAIKTARQSYRRTRL